ncbi:MAG: NAD(P)-binding protein [Pseudomonadota bacterium]
MAGLDTDYLIIGAGASGLAFADEMLTRSDAHLTLLDTRPEPGGHWNDAYPYVRLHQPSAFYGVGSRSLGDETIDADGPNAGYMSLASGGQVLGHFHAAMYDRLIPSGRVKFLPMHRANSDGSVTCLLSGETKPITVRRKTVDAAYMTNSVPKTHTRRFSVDPDVACVPPNDLPSLAAGHRHFTVLGAGKTAMDAVVWLLNRGADAGQIRWIVPRDSWLWDRATTQPTLDFFDEVYGGFLTRQRAIAEARDPRDLALRLEAGGIWMRLSEDHEPTVYRGATVSRRELALLRSVEDQVRLGRVVAISPGRLELQRGNISAPEDTLYIDCTATPFAAGQAPAVQVFNGDRITLQMIRFPQITFSSALIAYLETLYDTDAEKNRFAAPIEVNESLEGFVRALAPDFANRMNAGAVSELRAWTFNSRLDGFTRLASQIDPEDKEKRDLLNALKVANLAAVANLPRLISALDQAA